MEFMQKWLVCCGAATVIFCALSYLLAFLDKEPVQELSIAIVQTMFAVDGGSIAGYAVQNCIRAIAADKWGLKTEPIKQDEESEEEG